MFWKKKIIAYPPYDTLTQEQRIALYFLLEYFGSYVIRSGFDGNKQDAKNYLEKAARYFGLTKKDIMLFKPQYNDLGKIVTTIKTINNRKILARMVGNCSNLMDLAVGDEFKKIGAIFYDLWEGMGFTYEDIRFIVKFTTCRSDI